MCCACVVAEYTYIQYYRPNYKHIHLNISDSNNAMTKIVISVIASKQ